MDRFKTFASCWQDILVRWKEGQAKKKIKREKNLWFWPGLTQSEPGKLSTVNLEIEYSCRVKKSFWLVRFSWSAGLCLPVYKKVSLLGFLSFIFFFLEKLLGLVGELPSQTPENARRWQDGVGESATESSRVQNRRLRKVLKTLEILDRETKKRSEYWLRHFCKFCYLLID